MALQPLVINYPDSFTSLPTGVGITDSLVVFSPNFRSPYVEQGNLQVERQFGRHTALSVAYVFTHGVALLGNANGVTRQANGNFGHDLNLVPPELQPTYGGSFTNATITLPNGRTYVVPEYEGIDGLLNPNFGSINQVDNTGKSIYHALQVSLRHNGGQFQGSVSYTFSKNIDQGTGYYNQFDIAAQRGLSQLDQPHRLVLTGTWTPTFNRIVNGFTVSSVLTFASGRPFEPQLDNPTVNFQMVPGEGFNSFRGPAINDMDLSLARQVKLNERMNLRFMAEVFNLLNHPNYAQTGVNQVQYNTYLDPAATNPGNVYLADPNPSFGQPSATVGRYGWRQFQLSVRFNF